MKIALMSDIHSNTHALDACLKHARELGANQLAFLGDLVGYGADPAGVVDRVMESVHQGAWFVKGNHDAMAVRPPSIIQEAGASSAAWTHDQLNEAQLDFLDAAPLTVKHGHALLTHASAKNPDKWDYVDSELKAQHCLEAAQQDPEVQHVFVGHVHHQTLYYPGTGRGLMCFYPTPGVAVPISPKRPMVVTIGSLGQPRDGDTRAMYALYEPANNKLSFQRVVYDHLAAAAAVRRAGLPETLAARLELAK